MVTFSLLCAIFFGTLLVNAVKVKDSLPLAALEQQSSPEVVKESVTRPPIHWIPPEKVNAGNQPLVAVEQQFASTDKQTDKILVGGPINPEIGTHKSNSENIPLVALEPKVKHIVQELDSATDTPIFRTQPHIAHTVQYTQPHNPGTNAMEVSYQTLVKMIIEEREARLKLEHRQTVLEQTLNQEVHRMQSEMKSWVSNQTEDVPINTTGLTQMADIFNAKLQNISDKVSKISSNFVSVLNEIASSKNEATQLNKNLHDIDTRTKYLEMFEGTVNNVISGFNYKQEALDREIKAAIKNMSTWLSNGNHYESDLNDVRMKTKHLEETITDTNATISFLLSRINDGGSNTANITSIDNKINDLITSVNTSTRNYCDGKIATLRYLCLGEVKNLYKMTNANAGSINKNGAELSRQSQFIELNLTKTIRNVELKLNNEIQSLTEMHNKSSQVIMNNIDQLRTNENQIEQNLTKAMERLSLDCNQSVSEINAKLESQIMAVNISCLSGSQKIESSLQALNGKLVEINDNLTRSVDETGKASNKTIASVSMELKQTLQALEQRQNKSLHDIGEKTEQQKYISNSIKTNLTEEINQLNSSLHRKIGNVETEVKNEIVSIGEHCNSTIGNTLTKISELEKMQKTCCGGLEKHIAQVSEISLNNLTSLEKKLEVRIEMLNKEFNSTVSKLNPGLQTGLSAAFEIQINQTLDAIEAVTEKNISRIERRVMNDTVQLAGVNDRITQNALTVATIWQELNTLKNSYNKDVSDLKAEYSHNISSVETQFKTAITNIVKNEHANINSFLAGLGNLRHQFEDLQRNFSDVTHQVFVNSFKGKVAMTTCGSRSKAYSGSSVIPFSDIKTSYGIANFGDFNTTGKFSSQGPGLYLISAQIMSNSKGAEYRISKNGKEIIRVEVGPYHDDDTHNYHTGTGLAVVALDLNDKVWIEVLESVTSMYVFGAESCFTVIKLN
ncbi:putative leucine-rich repeat-containing protein DDB_G0290503 [Mytilus edulis]|uniref:putative leucine-rich repeat-containing protein DDB_G0290503 n=1 Tax=Mytilus edulis TaxID=6550 RepID=UPI0039EEB4F4